MADQQHVLSLYDACINAISYAFDIIDVNYWKDLPKHILEDVILGLNPLDLESLEADGLLSGKGISTDSLWKSHYSNRWKHVVVNYSIVQRNNWQKWRTLYFQRQFHELIDQLARSKDDDYLKIIRDERFRSGFLYVFGSSCHDCGMRGICGGRCQESPKIYVQLDRQLNSASKFNERRSNGLRYTHRIIDFCVQHLTQVRLYNVTCIFLESHRDMLTKLAGSIVHLEVHQLRDNGVESLSKILPLLVVNKLKSFSLFSCKVESEQNMRVLLTALFKPSMETISNSNQQKANDPCERDENQLTVLFDDDNEFKIKTTASTEERYKDLGITTVEGLKYEFLSDLDESDSERNVLKEKGLSMHSKHDDTNGMNNEYKCEDEDDLYEDVFSGKCPLQAGLVIESDNADGPCVNSVDGVSEVPSGKCLENLLRPSATVVQSCCLTELELFSCLMSTVTLKVFCESVKFFDNLDTLKLSETGSGLFPEMRELISRVKGLVMNGSLRHLVVENNTIDDRHGTMLCEMMICSCRKSSAQITKGLRSLRLVANGIGQTTTKYLAEKLMSCSYCADQGFIHETNEPTTNNMQTVSTSDHVIIDGLECLYLSAQVTSAGAVYIGRSLSHNRSLRSLSLPSCGLHTEDIHNIFRFITGCDSHECNNAIRKLDLRDNCYASVEQGSLCKLINQSQLVYLDLSFCGLEVIQHVVVLALRSNSALEVFKIAGNRLGDDGAVAISHVFEGLEKKSRLKTLDLRSITVLEKSLKYYIQHDYNRLTSSSLLHLGQLLVTWPRKLRQISIKGNFLDGSQEVVKACLEEVFDVVITEQFDASRAYVDYVSEM